MRLLGTATSPYTRKARVIAIEVGLGDRLEFVVQQPRDNSSGFHSVNPLACIPALVMDDGTALYDSPVICEYLNTEGRGNLIPAAGRARWDALRRQALADGMLDMALSLRGELARARERQSEEVSERLRATVERSLDAAHRDVIVRPNDSIDVGSIALACALEWLDLRFADWNWRNRRPELAAWHRQMSERASFRATRAA